MTFYEQRRQWERETIRAYLRKHNGSVQAAALELGLNRTHLFEMVRKLGVEREPTIRESKARKAETSRRAFRRLTGPQSRAYP